MAKKIDKKILLDTAPDNEVGEVVLSELDASHCEPSITFHNRNVFINMACLKRLPNVDYILFIVVRGERKLRLEPSSEDEFGSVKWRTHGKKRGARKIIMTEFVRKIMDLMNWNPENRYRLLGKFVCKNGKHQFHFDLTFPIVNRPASHDGGKLQMSRTPEFPEEWQDRFGLSVEEHHKRFQVKTFEVDTNFEIQIHHNPPPSIEEKKT